VTVLPEERDDLGIGNDSRREVGVVIEWIPPRGHLRLVACKIATFDSAEETVALRVPSSGQIKSRSHRRRERRKCTPSFQIDESRATSATAVIRPNDDLLQFRIEPHVHHCASAQISHRILQSERDLPDFARRYDAKLHGVRIIRAHNGEPQDLVCVIVQWIIRGTGSVTIDIDVFVTTPEAEIAMRYVEEL